MEIVLNSTDYTVFENILPFCQSRNIVLSDYDKMDIKDFNSKRIATGYFVFNGKRTANTNNVANAANAAISNNSSTNVIIIQICIQSESYKKTKLEKLLASASINEVIVIKPSSTKLKAVGCEILDCERYFLYDWIEYNIAKGRTVKLVSEQEFANEWQRLYVRKEILPSISHTMHEIVWHGFKIGDIVELIGPSMSSSGNTGSLRVVA